MIPDKRLEVEQRGETIKGAYDKSFFKYRAGKDDYKCPCGKVLKCIGDVEQNGRTNGRYANREACRTCSEREKCTKADHRVLSRDRNEEVKERMRRNIIKPKNKELYAKRAHTVESTYGRLKHAWKFRIFHRRGKQKVLMEVSLGFMLHNMLKIGQAV